jgi:hypothetical protein
LDYSDAKAYICVSQWPSMVATLPPGSSMSGHSYPSRIQGRAGAERIVGAVLKEQIVKVLERHIS